MTTLLADTHAVIWWLADEGRLPEPCRAAMADPANEVLVSAVSAWEVAIKSALGKLTAPDDLLEAATASGLEWIPIEPGEAYSAGTLPLHHRDPFDRLLVAQALARSARLVSADEVFDAYGVRRLWATSAG